MAKAVVTQELVFQVAESLVAQGVTPTILNVQDGIGGGSYTTVKRYLDQWREAAPKQRRPVELPETAVAKLMNLGCEFWGLLDEQAGQQVEAIRAATGEEIAAIQAQLDQAEQAIARLEAERDQAESRAVEQEHALRESTRLAQAYPFGGRDPMTAMRGLAALLMQRPPKKKKRERGRDENGLPLWWLFRQPHQEEEEIENEAPALQNVKWWLLEPHDWTEPEPG